MSRTKYINSFNVFLMYFEDLSMRRSINGVSAHQNGGFCSSEKIEPITAVCVLLVSRTNLLFSLVNGIKINVHFITLLCLCLNYM